MSKIDGRRVVVKDTYETYYSVPVAGSKGTLLHFHNGGDMFDRWVAYVRWDDGHDVNPCSNIDPFALEVIEPTTCNECGNLV